MSKLPEGTKLHEDIFARGDKVAGDITAPMVTFTLSFLHVELFSHKIKFFFIFFTNFHFLLYFLINFLFYFTITVTPNPTQSR